MDGATCLCIAGMGRVTPASSCTPCDADAYKADIGNEACTSCPPGAVGSATAQTSITACACNAKAQLALNVDRQCACALNTYGNPASREFTACSSCESGKHTGYATDPVTLQPTLERESQRIDCSFCPKHLPVRSGGPSGNTRDECHTCPSGSVPNADKSSCQLCPLATWAAQDAAGFECRPCLQNEMTLMTGATSRSSCLCVEGFYRDSTALYSERQLCVPCEQGAYCGVGTESVEMMRALPSFWRASPKSKTFWPCSADFYTERGVLVTNDGALNMVGNCLGGRNSTCAPIWPLQTVREHFLPEADLREFRIEKNMVTACALSQTTTSTSMLTPSDGGAASAVQVGTDGMERLSATEDPLAAAGGAAAAGGSEKPIAFCESELVRNKALGRGEPDGKPNFKYLVMHYYYMIYKVGEEERRDLLGDFFFN